MSQLKPPQFLVDVFRDLRDRRLLIPAAALLVALIAVPMLLGRSSEPMVPPPSESPAVAFDDAATQPAVLTEEVSVRDYEKRLDDLKSKNPFTQHFTLPPSDGGGLAPADGAAAAPPSSSGGDTLSGTGTSTPAGSDIGNAPVPSSSSSPPATTPAPKPPRVETRYYSWRIDVEVGPNGAAEERNDVKQLSMLPSKNKPVVVFLGIVEGGNEAVFAVSDDVSSVTGSGQCSGSACGYLTLKEHEMALLDYDPDGVRYKLRLNHIKQVAVGKPDAKLAGKL